MERGDRIRDPLGLVPRGDEDRETRQRGATRHSAPSAPAGSGRPPTRPARSRSSRAALPSRRSARARRPDCEVDVIDARRAGGLIPVEQRLTALASRSPSPPRRADRPHGGRAGGRRGRSRSPRASAGSTPLGDSQLRATTTPVTSAVVLPSSSATSSAATRGRRGSSPTPSTSSSPIASPSDPKSSSASVGEVLLARQQVLRAVPGRVGRRGRRLAGRDAARVAESRLDRRSDLLRDRPDEHDRSRLAGQAVGHERRVRALDVGLESPRGDRRPRPRPSCSRSSWLSSSATRCAFSVSSAPRTFPEIATPRMIPTASARKTAARDATW